VVIAADRTRAIHHVTDLVMTVDGQCGNKYEPKAGKCHIDHYEFVPTRELHHNAIPALEPGDAERARQRIATRPDFRVGQRQLLVVHEYAVRPLDGPAIEVVGENALAPGTLAIKLLDLRRSVTVRRDKPLERGSRLPGCTSITMRLLLVGEDRRGRTRGGGRAPFARSDQPAVRGHGSRAGEQHRAHAKRVLASSQGTTTTFDGVQPFRIDTSTATQLWSVFHKTAPTPRETGLTTRTAPSRAPLLRRASANARHARQARRS